jgi:hypothetical protein
MSTKNTCLALTAGFATVAEAHRSAIVQAAATVPANCTTSYSIETGADGRAVSVANLTCSRPAQRLASGAAL